MNCPNCNSERVSVICKHHNRRKKIPVEIMLCDNCKKRFTVEGDKKDYDHTGNAHKKNKLCYFCHEHLDNDTERIIEICFNCVAKSYDNYGHQLGSFDDWWYSLVDHEEYFEKVKQ